MPMKNPPHPGKLINSAIEELGLSTAQAAAALGVSRNQLHRVVVGSSNVSPEMALRLEVVIGSTADTWLRLQAAFDTAQVRERADEITKGLKRVKAPAAAPVEQPRLV